jgi:hypothetical protein
MTSAFGSAVVAVWLAATATEPAPIGGAFGFTFGNPLVHASAAPLPAERVPPKLLDEFIAIDAPLHLQPQWQVVTPLLPLDVLDNSAPLYLVQIDESALPLRIRVEAQPSDGCARQQREVADLLAVKYAPNASAPWIDGVVEYSDGERRATLRCEDKTLILEYVDRAAYAAWYDRWVASSKAWHKADAERRHLAFADRITLGDAKRLDGALGVELRATFAGFGAVLPDVALPVPVSADLPLPVENLSVVLDPDRVPYEIRASLRYPTATAATNGIGQLRNALREKYGVPARDTPEHLIFNVGGDLLAIRLADPTHVAVTAVRQEGLQAQRMRKRDALARRDASTKAGWDSSLRGL